MITEFDAKTKLDELRERWKHCSACSLHADRNNVVFGEGNPNADVLLIGEAPGEKEDRAGVPFYGSAGILLNKFLNKVELDRETDLFITNTVGCRPTIDGADYKGNMQIEDRKPNKAERLACRERLLETIYIVDPLIIVTVGIVPAQALLGRVPTISNLRGIVHTLRIQGRHRMIAYPVMPIYDIGLLLRDKNRRGDGPWGQTASDFMHVKAIINYLRKTYG